MGGIVSGKWESLGDIGYRQGVEFILREAYSANNKLASSKMRYLKADKL